MPTKGDAAKLIRSLESGRFYAECPHCGEGAPLREAGLFYMDDFSEDAEQWYDEQLAALRERRRELRELRRNIPEVSRRGAKAVNIGFILERLAPALPGFRFDRNDCRSLFDPIDYVIFEGLSEKNKVSRILFSDVKTGNARLSTTQRGIRDLVGRKQVEVRTYEAGR